MICDPLNRAKDIQQQMKSSAPCRIWADVPEEKRLAAIRDFAAQHGLRVKFHESAGSGIVTEFSLDGIEGG